MELLEQFVRGDLDAFESIFREHQNEVYGWIVRIVRNPAAAEDLTIETFWRIYRARARFDATRELGPWARRIATYLAYNHLKAARPETAWRASELGTLARGRQLGMVNPRDAAHYSQ
jgi:RNA polymerase sigma-70 factor (ECF subfamily)